jgi:stage III sporulation protein AG
VLVLLALGIVLMFSGSLFQPRKEETAVFSPQTSTEAEQDAPAFASKNDDSSVIDKYEKDYEDQLRDALETVKGVKDVSVIVNLDSSEVKVIEKETETRTQSTDETDRDGGQRKVTESSTNQKPTIIREDNKEAPIVTKVDKPEVRGVLIVAKGADNIEVKKMIIEAVTRTLGVPSHRVSVLPKKQ